MQTRKNFVKGHHQSTIMGILILMLIISNMFLLSACSTSSETTKETTQPVDHDLDIDPTPLTDKDKSLSLEGYGAKGAAADKNLSVNDMLMYAVQDEYLAIIDKFGNQKPYSNIVSAEETHLSFLKELYVSYGLDFPVDNSADHIVIPTNLLEAAETGVQAEIDNIAMYELFLTYDLPSNVFKVFTELKNGSDSHLLAFQKQVDKLK